MTAAEGDASDLAVRWRRAEATVWRRTLEGVVVLPVAGPAPLTLRGPAAGIWELLATPTTMHQVLDAIAENYAVDERALAGDVGRAVDALSEAGALCRL